MTLFAEEQKPATKLSKLWNDGKITPEQPFKANVVGIVQSWVGYELLLKEVTDDAPRYCYVNIAMTFPIKYVETTKLKSSQLLINAPNSKWTNIDPSILSSSFNYEKGVYKLGQKFGKNDLLLVAISNSKMQNPKDSFD
ncbi:MAG: hypothetical protein ACI9SQ_001892 [Rubritalea sp.]|jgi:hypothetical protein